MAVYIRIAKSCESLKNNIATKKILTLMIITSYRLLNTRVFFDALIYFYQCSYVLDETFAYFLQSFIVTHMYFYVKTKTKFLLRDILRDIFCLTP